MEYYGNRNILVDTITKHLICCLDFKTQKSDLEKTPFITNEEIYGFDFNNSSISLSKSAMKKILKLPNIRKQFVVCINNKPELNGYFIVSPFNSYFIENYIFHYNYSKSKDSLNEKTYTFLMFYGKEYRKLDSINENSFYKALSKTDRIINNKQD